MSADWHRRNEIEALAQALNTLHKLNVHSRKYVSEFSQDHPPQRPIYARALMDDPIGHSYRLAIREVGQRLHELGGTDLMEKMANMVDEAWSAHEWDGIGGWWS